MATPTQIETMWEVIMDRFKDGFKSEDWLDENTHKLKWEFTTKEEAKREFMDVIQANFTIEERHMDCNSYCGFGRNPGNHRGKCIHQEEDCPQLKKINL